MDDGGDEDADDEEGVSSSLRDLADSVSEQQKHGGGDDIDIDLSQDADDGGSSFNWNSFKDKIAESETELVEGLGEFSNVLILGPLTHSSTNNQCASMMAPDATDDSRAILITVTRTTKERLETWQAQVPALPSMTCLIGLGETQSAKQSSSIVYDDDEEKDITTKSVPDPSDLTRLGITINQVISEWNQSGSNIVLCFHSLTGLLQYVEPQRLFRFIHILMGKVETADIQAHFHMDPAAHDQQTVAIFRSQFETIVEQQEDGSYVLVEAP